MENSDILWGYISYQGVEFQRETKKIRKTKKKNEN